MRAVGPLPESLKESYDFECCKCGHQQNLRPSIIMHMGLNQGHGHCKGCHEFLALHIEGESAWSEPWEDNIKRIKEKNGNSESESRSGNEVNQEA